MSLIDEQLITLQAEFPGASITPSGGGSHVVTLPNVTLPEGWNLPKTIIKFVVLANYPHGAPDCFWVEPNLRLKNGSSPKNTNIQIIPGTSDNWLWFSWHTSRWSPNRDTLYTYAKVIETRLKVVE
ncbi:MAG: E2/UBC family protein [Bacteroidota bacterium]